MTSVLDRIQLARAAEEVSRVHDVEEPREQILIRPPVPPQTCAWSDAPCAVVLGRHNTTKLCRPHYQAMRARARRPVSQDARPVNQRVVESLKTKLRWHLAQATKLEKALEILK